jgi:hypothetical protein
VHACTAARSWQYYDPRLFVTDVREGDTCGEVPCREEKQERNLPPHALRAVDDAHSRGVHSRPREMAEPPQ